MFFNVVNASVARGRLLAKITVSCEFQLIHEDCQLFSPETHMFCWKPFPPSGGRCFPFNVEQWGQESRGRGSAERWGEARKKLSMRCDARLQPTHLNYGELWWHLRDMGRAGCSKTLGRDEMTHPLDSLVKYGKEDRYEEMDSRPKGSF